MDTFAQDIRFGLRRLLNAPAFTLVATLLLTFGTGANIALFAVTDALLLRPRPGVRDADRLVWVSSQGRGRGRLSYQDFERFRTESGVFKSLAGFDDQQVVVAVESGASPERLRGQAVTGEYFSVLGTPMQLGRGLGPADDTRNAPIAVVLSHSLWMRRFAAEASVIGRQITVNGRRATVVGVAPPHFNGADVDEPRQLWVPLAALEDRASFEDRRITRLITVARLRDGVEGRAADAALATIARSIAGTDTALKNFTVRTASAATGIPPGGAAKAAPIVGLCLGVTLTILLIACANVGNLLLARGIVRQREFGVRMALGATRARVIRQLLVESGLLGVMGTVLGTLVATWGLEAFNAASILPVDVNASIDIRVLVGTIAVALAATLLFGVVPAVDATRRDVNAAIKDGSQGLDPRRARMQSRLVVVQVVMSVVMLATAALFVQSLQKQQEFALGFETSDSVLSAAFNVDELGFPQARRKEFTDRLRARVATLPGVEAVAYADQLPLGELTVFADIEVDRARTAPLRGGVFRTSIDPAYFSILHIALRGGRAFNDGDHDGAERVVIVSETLARHFWSGTNVIGQRIRISKDGPYATVVGVAADAYVWGASAEPPRAMIYFPKAQNEIGLGTHLLVRVRGDARPLIPAIEREARAIDPAVPLSKIQTMAGYRADNLGEPRNASRLMAIFGGLAFVLASVGLYAVVSFVVEQRKREIGIRVALGALQRDVVRLFVRGGARLVATGLVVGLVLSFLLSRLLSSMLFGVTALDVAGAAIPVSVLMLVSLLAAWVPSRRAGRVDPVLALRSE
jgi:predicted permease